MAHQLGVAQMCASAEAEPAVPTVEPAPILGGRNGGEEKTRIEAAAAADVLDGVVENR